MERITREIIEVIAQVKIWRESQREHASDINYFHYSQNKIDELESKLDGLMRWKNEYL